MSDIRAEFEPGIWKDFSKEHAALRQEVERSLMDYRNGKAPDPIAVWGAYGAGKTQFLFWVAEKALELSLTPIYLHLNDLFDGLPDAPSPDTLRDHAGLQVGQIIAKLRESPQDPLLLKTYRDKNLLRFVTERVATFDPQAEVRPVLLVDEVEQIYKSLREHVRADDRSPLRAWLEQEFFKVCAFAVGSLYVLGRADRERLRVWPIPVVRPSNAKQLLSALPEPIINALWWLSRGKPRHLVKAARRYEAVKPEGPIEVREFVKELDSVSQAPYEADSQNVVPAAYTDQLGELELAGLLSIGPQVGNGEGKLFRLEGSLEHELLVTVRDAFKLEAVSYDLVRYIRLLLEAVSVDGRFALSERDTPHLLRLAVDFLLEYERERIEKDTMEGAAALRKLLEVHDSAQQRAGEVFWKLQGKLNATEVASCSLSFEAMASTFPLPTTSPTLFGTMPAAVRSKHEDSKSPVFAWNDSIGNSVVFLTSFNALLSYSGTPAFRQRALAPKSGVIVLLPYDVATDEWLPTGFLEWLQQHDRMRLFRLPLALTDFLLSLRQHAKEGDDPFPIAEQAESQHNLQRQVAFYRSRLKAFADDATGHAKRVTPTDIPRRFSEMLARVGDRDVLDLITQQAFESLSPRISGYLIDLREFVLNSKALWHQRGGHISLAEDLLPHRSARTNRPEQAKIIEDLKLSFSSYLESLHRLVTLVGVNDVEYLTDDPVCKGALRSLWRAKRGGDGNGSEQLAVYAAQLNDVVTTLKLAGEAETRLRQTGVLVDFGALGVLMQARPQLEKVATDTNALLGTPGGSDGRLTIAVFEQFLGTLLGSVQSGVASTKTTLSKIRNALEGIDDSKGRIVESCRHESMRFAGVQGEQMIKLLADLWQEAVTGLGPNPPVDEIARAVEGLSQDYEQIETLLARLNSAYAHVARVAGKQVP